MRTVTVTGQGSTREVPDSVVVRVAASHRAAGVVDALTGVQSAAEEIIATAREHTGTSQIASTNLNLWPAFDNEGKPSGFEARHAFTITCPDITAAASMLGELPAAVGDRLQIESLGLEVGDISGALVKARAAAFADAVARAQHLAELAGVQLGDVQALAEGNAAAVPFADLAGGMREAKAMTIAPGETTIAASLTVTFELA